MHHQWNPLQSIDEDDIDDTRFGATAYANIPNHHNTHTCLPQTHKHKHTSRSVWLRPSKRELGERDKHTSPPHPRAEQQMWKLNFIYWQRRTAVRWNKLDEIVEITAAWSLYRLRSHARTHTPLQIQHKTLAVWWIFVFHYRDLPSSKVCVYTSRQICGACVCESETKFRVLYKNTKTTDKTSLAESKRNRKKTTCKCVAIACCVHRSCRVNVVLFFFRCRCDHWFRVYRLVETQANNERNLYAFDAVSSVKWGDTRDLKWQLSEYSPYPGWKSADDNQNNLLQPRHYLSDE